MYKQLKINRKMLNLTQREVADHLKISVRNYQRIEAGTQTPRLKLALAIAKVLNTTVEDLFESPSRQTRERNQSSNKNSQNNNII